MSHSIYYSTRKNTDQLNLNCSSANRDAGMDFCQARPMVNSKVFKMVTTVAATFLVWKIDARPRSGGSGLFQRPCEV